MSVNGASGFHVDTTPVDNSLHLIGTVIAPATLFSIDVQGIVSTPMQAFTEANGATSFFNIQAGIQFGPQGYGGVPLNGGSTTGASWVTWGDMLPAFAVPIVVPGGTPVTFSEQGQYTLTRNWRGSMRVTSNTDVYVAVGSDTGLATTWFFETFYSYRLLYAF